MYGGSMERSQRSPTGDAPHATATDSRRPLLLIPILLASSLLAAWCAGTASAATNLPAVRGRAAEVRGRAEFTAPGGKIDVKSLKGKTIYSIPQSSSIPFLSTTEKAEASIAKAAGVKFVGVPQPGADQRVDPRINQAVAAHASAILLNALDPRLVAPQLAAAKKAGVKVVSAQFFDLSQLKQVPSTVSAVRPDNFTQAAKLEADWAISGHRRQGRRGGRREPRAALDRGDDHGAEGAVRQVLLDVQGQVHQRPRHGMGHPRSSRRCRALSPPTPDINYVIPIYDPMSQFVIPAITASGRTSKVGIATFNGTPFALKDSRAAPRSRWDISENLAWLAAANMDELYRTMLGQKGVTDENTAMRVFTSKNISDAGTPAAVRPRTRQRLEVGLRRPVGRHPVSAAVARTAATGGLTAERITKRFGGQLALDAVSLDLAPGSVHGLLGEERVRQVDAHQDPQRPLPPRRRTADDRRVTRCASPSHRGPPPSTGLRFVHQDLGLIPTLTVAENFGLAGLAENRTGWRTSQRSLATTAATALERFDVDVDPAAKTNELTALEHALVAIVARSMRFRPTAACSCSTSRRSTSRGAT